MSDTPKTGLEIQIEAEAKELAELPKIPVAQFLGSHRRCHICGGIYNSEDLRKFDTHVQGAEREACPNCHPQRGI